MIDTRHYILLDIKGYDSKSEAYEYSHINGVTTYFDGGLWYIVQARY